MVLLARGALPLLAFVLGCDRSEPPTLVSTAPSSTSSVSGSATSATLAASSADDPVIVDLQPSDGPLKGQIAREKEKAGSKTFLVQTTASWCPPCVALKKYMGDPQMKKALEGVRLARIDIDSFSKEDVEGCELSAGAVPWFVKLDADLHPVDAVTSNEWGDDVPPNMAPVLAAFVKGTLTQRKKSWSPGKWH
jgi:thiol-disulfide isomerase/thioredoxin